MVRKIECPKCGTKLEMGILGNLQCPKCGENIHIDFEKEMKGVSEG